MHNRVRMILYNLKYTGNSILSHFNYFSEIGIVKII